MKLVTLFFALLGINYAFGQVITIDSSFNGIGYDSINLNHLGYDVQTGDNILVNPSDKKYIVRAFVNPLGAYIKYNRNGKRDTSFNHTGILVQQGSERYTKNFLIDSFNRLVNAVNEPLLTSRTGFMRTLPNGTPDRTLDQDGIYYVPGPVNVEGVWTPGPGNSFFACGTFGTVFSDGSRQLNGLRIAKFKSDFSVDSTFGINGIQKVFTDTTRDLFFEELQFTSDGKIVIPYFYRTAPFPDQDFDAALVQLSPDGKPDSSFGVNGIARSIEVTPVVDVFWGCRILRDNHILAFGWNGMRQGFLEKFLPDGKIDSSFGVFGRAYIGYLGVIYAVQEQRDGKLLLCGYNGYNIVRITADGILDRQFGTSGLYKSPFSPFGFAYNLLLENDTTALITGNAFESSQSNNVTTARYRLQWQPLVTGIRSNYCFDGTVTGQIINYPAADTTVTAFVDSLPVTINSSGIFSFITNSVGPHELRIIFSKDTLRWKQSIYFTTDTFAVANIIDTSQTVCNNTPLQIRAAIPVYWRSSLYNSDAPSTSFSFNGSGLTGTIPVIAVRDNRGCGISRDTVMMNVIAAPAAGATPVQNSTMLTAPVTADSYQWFLNSVPLPGATSKTYNFTQTGAYSYTYKFNGCTSPKSSTIFVTITSIVDPNNNKEIILFPNPATTDLYIQQLNPSIEYVLLINNTVGINFLQTPISNSSLKRISLKRFHGGLYIVSLYNAKTGKLIGWNKIIVAK